MQRTTIVSQRPIRYRRGGRKISVQRKRRGGAVSAPSNCAFDFLKEGIADLMPTMSECMDVYGIDVDKSYARMLSSAKRFFKFVGVEFGFTPNSISTKPQMLADLIEHIEEVLEPLGLKLFVSKKSPKGEMQKVLECAVYRPDDEFDDMVLVLCVSPARYLSPQSAELFKRFMKFFSQCTRIPLGIIGNYENYHLNWIVDIYDEEYYEVEDMKDVLKAYKEDGDFWNLFDEIENIGVQDVNTLTHDLEGYRQNCPVDEINMIDVMLQGIPIIKDMNAYWFDLNPQDDGLPNEYGSYDDDGQSLVYMSAILYSMQDGVCDLLLDAINNDVNAGVIMYGWNIHQYLSPTMKKSDVMEFMRCKDLIKSFASWICNFCRETEKFDRYGKSE